MTIVVTCWPLLPSPFLVFFPCAVLYPLKKMPLTPNGKIDKAKLPYPDAAIIKLNRNQQASPFCPLPLPSSHKQHTDTRTPPGHKNATPLMPLVWCDACTDTPLPKLPSCLDKTGAGAGAHRG